MKRTALFRADASPQLGAGHVSRCLALAEALAEAGWQISFVVGPDTISTAPFLAKAGYTLRVLDEADADIAALRATAGAAADLLIVDHYGLDAAFETACRTFARKILVLDDATGRRHDCDILVDAAASGSESYAELVPGHARVLAGPAYALLRRSFILHRDTALTRRDGRPVREILVSCGATDPANATAAVLGALVDITHETMVTVVLASRAPHVNSVRERLQAKARLLLDVDDMAELMTNADLAIGAPGSTAYERAMLGLPSIFATLADNQRGIGRLMAAAGAAADAGKPDEGFSRRVRDLVGRFLRDGEARMQMARAAACLIDGCGPLRVAEAVS
jgi:UDP-2,4-diacetamido-2,4,6-trideoxy-beta-L-altropyranose hydrolase